MSFELGAGEAGVCVGAVVLRNHTMIATGKLKCFFRAKGFMSIQSSLMFGVNESGSRVHKQAAAFVKLGVTGLAEASIKSSKGGTDKVID